MKLCEGQAWCMDLATSQLLHSENQSLEVRELLLQVVRQRTMIEREKNFNHKSLEQNCMPLWYELDATLT